MGCGAVVESTAASGRKVGSANCPWLKRVLDDPGSRFDSVESRIEGNRLESVGTAQINPPPATIYTKLTKPFNKQSTVYRPSSAATTAAGPTAAVFHSVTGYRPKNNQGGKSMAS